MYLEKVESYLIIYNFRSFRMVSFLRSPIHLPQSLVVSRLLLEEPGLGPAVLLDQVDHHRN